MTQEEQEHILRIVPILSKAEYEIFLWIGEGKTTKEIAFMPGRVRSIKSIETHLTHMKTKFDLGNCVQLRMYAARYKTLLDTGLVKHTEDYGTQPRRYREIQLCSSHSQL